MNGGTRDEWGEEMGVVWKIRGGLRGELEG